MAAIPVAIVFSVALALLWHSAGDVPFHGDEGDYIWNARYVGYLVLEFDSTNPEWGDSYWTHTQPMLVRYIAGAWLLARGEDIEHLPPAYMHSQTPEENRRQGRIPDDALLHLARQPFVVVTALAVTLLYVLGKELGGVLAGLSTVSLALVNPLTRETMVRVTPEAPLAALLLLTLLLGIRRTKRRYSMSLPVVGAIGVGVAAGLAVQAKLTGAMSVVSLGYWGAIIAIGAAWRTNASPRGRIIAAWLAGSGWVLAMLVATAVFVGTNPHLYPNPIEHTSHLAHQRVTEMHQHREWFPSSSTRGIRDQLRYVLGGSLVIGHLRNDGDPVVGEGIPVGLVFAPIGVVLLLWRCWQSVMRVRRIPREGLVLTTTAVYVLMTAGTIHMYWSRYLLPTVLLGSLLTGLGIAAVIRWLVAGICNASAARRRCAHTTSPESGIMLIGSCVWFGGSPERGPT